MCLTTYLKNSLFGSSNCILLAIFGVFLMQSTVDSQVTRTWNPQGSSQNWHDAANWDPFGVPLSMDDVIQSDGIRPISLSSGSTAEIDSLLITSSGRLFTAGNTLRVHQDGDLGHVQIVGSGSELIVDSGSSSSSDAEVDIIDIETGGRLRMNGGNMRVDRLMSMDISSRISGFGNVRFSLQDEQQTPTVLEVNGTIQPLNGLLTIETEEFSRVDLTSAHLDAGFGDLKIDATFDEPFGGTVTVRSGQFLELTRQTLIGADGVLNLHGGTTGNEAIFINSATYTEGRLNVSNSTSMQGALILGKTAEVSLPDPTDRLRVDGGLGMLSNGNDSVDPEPMITGLGIVEISEGSELILINHSVIDATVVNSGSIDLVSGGFLFTLEAGSGLFNNLILTSDGTLNYDITSLAGFTVADWYQANGIVELDGKLRVESLDTDGVQPELNNGDVFPIVASAAAVFGEFAEVELPEAPAGLFWQLNYRPASVELELVDYLRGDVNGDGAINLLDVQPFIAAVTNGNFLPEADINQDGFVNLLDVQPFVELLTS